MSRSSRAAQQLIVALDVSTAAQALAMGRRLRGLVRTVKVGSALFTACGPDVIRRLRALGFGIMLDLKFFDIPSTVELSCRAAVRHRVTLLTVHASGQPEMLRAAVLGARDEARRLRMAPPVVLGVTVLTSVGAGTTQAVRAHVLALAARAAAAGCGGVVASAHEAAAIRARFGTRLRIVCPGVRPACATPVGAKGGAAGRPAAAARGDQRRVVGPGDALRRGADFLVVGRPITGSRDPRQAARDILSVMEAEG